MLYQIYNHSPSARVCISDTTRPLMLYILHIFQFYLLYVPKKHMVSFLSILSYFMVLYQLRAFFYCGGKVIPSFLFYLQNLSTIRISFQNILNQLGKWRSSLAETTPFKHIILTHFNKLYLWCTPIGHRVRKHFCKPSPTVQVRINFY